MATLNNNFKKLFITFILFLVIFFLTAMVEAVQADTLIIQDNGGIVLVLDNGVLAATTDIKKPPEKKPAEKLKEVPLVSPATKTVVTITPPTTNDKKLNVTISTVPTTPSTAPTSLVTKTVDRVVAEDKQGQPIISITPSGKNNLTISQQTNLVNTTLPLQINAQTYELNVVSTGTQQKINVLPGTAVTALVQKGIITNPTDQTKPNITLVKEKTDVIYKISSENSLKVLGLFNVKWPVQVDISAQTGKTLSTKQPLYGSLLSIFKFGL